MQYENVYSYYTNNNKKGVTSDSYEYFQEWYIVALGGGIKPQTLP